MRRLSTVIVATVIVAGVVSGCMEHPLTTTGSKDPQTGTRTPDSGSDTGLVVSAPVPNGASLSRQGGYPVSFAMRAAADQATPSDVAYVSLPPGTDASGIAAVVENSTGSSTLRLAMVDGGFDPAPIPADVGDTIHVHVLHAGNTSGPSFNVAVPKKRAPTIIRTVPGRGKADVPVNQVIVVVFNEPVSGATLSSASVKLLHGHSEIPGDVRLLAGTATSVAFQTGLLEPNTAYQLVVTQAVHDLAGEAVAKDDTLSFTTGSGSVMPATVVKLLPDTSAVQTGWAVQLTVAAHDTTGAPVVGHPILWSSDDPQIATVSDAGLVTTLAPGTAHIHALLDGIDGKAVIIVSASLASVASVDVSSGPGKAVVGGFVQFKAILRDIDGNVLSYRQVDWQSSDPSIASVTPGSGGTAIVTGLELGTASITATSEGASASATITVGTIPGFSRLATGTWMTCGIASDAAAWCWGYSPDGIAILNDGQLGNGTQLGSRVPVAVAGGLQFAKIAVGDGVTCGLTIPGRAYCWGWAGALGIGNVPGPQLCFPAQNGSTDVTCSTSPVPVSTSLTFTDIQASSLDQVCALASSGIVYCWGPDPRSPYDPLTGMNAIHYTPIGIAGAPSFTKISVGYDHACGLPSSGQAYCWGLNYAGQLGASGLPPFTDYFEAVPVWQNVPFVALAAGTAHTCALTADGSAYCWGMNDNGELGLGTTAGPRGPCYTIANPNRIVQSCSPIAVSVDGGLHFTSVVAGDHHTCGLTPNGETYCWGAQPGVGTTDATSAVPIHTALSFTFASLSAGPGRTCGITSAGVAYCWGNNESGAFGDGTTTSSPVPVKVSGQP